MRANKLETAVHSMPFCSGPPDFFMDIARLGWNFEMGLRWMNSILCTLCVWPTTCIIHVHVCNGCSALSSA